MGVRRKRGRPKQQRPEYDRGTRELQRHRAQHETLEPLALCLKLQVITPEHYDAGMWLAWLHSTQYGVIRPRTVQWGEVGSAPERTDAWRAARKRELDGAVKVLERYHAAKLVWQLCVFQERPYWLRADRAHVLETSEFVRFKNALQQIVLFQHRLGAKILVRD